jgi:hypothetical protein
MSASLGRSLSFSVDARRVSLTLLDAIRRHGGEGRDAVRDFRRLPQGDQQAII